MNVKIEIDTKTFVRFWLVVIGFVLAGMLLYSASTALIIVGSALFAAIALNPPVNRLARLLPGKSRVAGTALAYITVLILLGAIIFLIIPTIIEQTSKFIQTIPTLVTSATQGGLGLSELVDKYHLQGQIDSVINSAKASFADLAKGVGYNLILSIGSVFSFITSGILILVLTFLMLVEGPIWIEKIWSVYNDEDRMQYHKRMATRMYNVVTNYIIGQLSVSAVGAFSAGIMVFLMCLAFNVPFNLIIPSAAIIFVLALIPLFGSVLGGIIVALILALNNITAALVFIIIFIIYQQVEANYISPKIQSKRMELSALMILVAVTVGIYMFGIIGGIISIPIAGCIKVLVEDYFARAKVNRENSKKPLNKFFKKLQEK